MAGYFISTSNFSKFVNKLLDTADIFAPVIIEDKPRLIKIDTSNIPLIDLNSYRTSEPIKSLFLKAKEDISEYFNGQKDVNDIERKKVVFCKACDIAAMMFEDMFFSEEIEDPFYVQNRSNTVIISSDCGDAITSCHCTILKVKPYPEKNYDLNLSGISDGFLVDIGSEKGRELVDNNRMMFIDGTPSQREQQSKKREAMFQKVLDINIKYQYRLPLEGLTKNGLENEIWREIGKWCTECGGCNIVCPTCTCFLLYDDKKSAGNIRRRQWDSCMKAGYARVAGGANTRPLLYRRTQNRWQCKFDYMFDKYGLYACSGCGRCTEVCMAKIDLREAFLELEKQSLLRLKLE